ncbi:hypothetical protein [methane-oxidizing endosymbiont of Gigantopelta aegis]|nr:hypothetical protein [methane-oxidizing endosymbiont of Gigantopelta aegis]
MAIIDTDLTGQIIGCAFAVHNELGNRLDPPLKNQQFSRKTVVTH